MLKVDFYILESGTDPFVFACRLIEKAYLRHHSIYALASHETEAHELDERLWTYKDESFLPHHLVGEGPEPPPPIQIGLPDSITHHKDILLNLTDELPNCYTQFRRILELVKPNPESQTKARERYRFYRKSHALLSTHKLELVD